MIIKRSTCTYKLHILFLYWFSHIYRCECVYNTNIWYSLVSKLSINIYTYRLIYIELIDFFLNVLVSIIKFQVVSHNMWCQATPEKTTIGQHWNPWLSVRLSLTTISDHSTFPIYIKAIFFRVLIWFCFRRATLIKMISPSKLQLFYVIPKNIVFVLRKQRRSN